MPSIDVGGVSLYYEERGRGQTIVFCHGIPTDYRAWENQVERFSKEFRVITYSRRHASPNSGNGDVSNGTVENNASDLRGLIEKVGAGPVHLVGHSYGGFISAFFASEHPESVKSLALVEPAISTILVENADSPPQMLSLLFRSPSVALSARRFKNGSLGPSLKALDSGRPDLATALNVDGVEDKKGAFGSFAEDQKRMFLENAKTIGELRTKFPSFRERARTMGVRTLVINGEASPLWLRRIGELTAGEVPHSESFVCPGARHFPHIENPSAFNDHLREFISKQ